MHEMGGKMKTNCHGMYTLRAKRNRYNKNGFTLLLFLIKTHQAN